MKFRINLCDPDAITADIDKAIEITADIDGLTTDERDDVYLFRRAELWGSLANFIADEDVLAVEIDTDEETTQVIRV